MSIDFINEANQIKNQMIEWRRHIHQHPEVGMNLLNTSAYIQKELKKMDIPFEVIADGSAVVATLGKGNKCILLRSDMDALPMKEEANVQYKSNNDYMHACGHDMHAANLLGCAKLLKAHERELNGVVKMLFQPGEEIFEGAKKCIEDGVLDNPKVDRAFAIHVNSQLPRNVIAYGLNPMASVFGFKIHLKGVGGHGSSPETCIDPINTGVHIYLALQELVARECAASQKVVLTLGQFNAGSVANIIPNEAVLSGTLRTFDPKVTEYMKKRIQEVVQGICAVYRTELDFTILSDCPALICDEQFNYEIVDIIKGMHLNSTDSQEDLTSIASTAYTNKDTLFISNKYTAMASEDFAMFSKYVPTAYYLLGACVDNPKEIYGQHHPKVQFSEDTLPLGAAVYASVAFEWLNK